MWHSISALQTVWYLVKYYEVWGLPIFVLLQSYKFLSGELCAQADVLICR